MDLNSKGNVAAKQRIARKSWFSAVHLQLMKYAKTVEDNVAETYTLVREICDLLQIKYDPVEREQESDELARLFHTNQHYMYFTNLNLRQMFVPRGPVLRVHGTGRAPLSG